MRIKPEPQVDGLRYHQRETCRVCRAKTLVHVLSLGEQYVVAFPKTRDESLPKAPITLVRCALCGLLQLLHTVDRDLMYREYWYRSSVNQTMREALRDIVHAGTEMVWEGRWLDIGANDGCLLSYVPDVFERVAVEPAQTFRSQLEEFADHVVSGYFSAGAVTGQFDVITSAAMFYDVDDPEDFCKDIAAVLTKDGVWINQISDAPTMLDKNAFDALCHEHLCYYTVRDLETIYRKAGLKVTLVTHNEVNGGSIRVFAQRDVGSHERRELREYATISAAEADRFALRVGRWKNLMREILNVESIKYQPLWAYGASTKGSTLLQYLDCNERFIGVADRNPEKAGRMMVGSWIPITDEQTLRKAKPRTMVVLPWAFRDEFVRREEGMRQNGTSMIMPLPNPEFIL